MKETASSNNRRIVQSDFKLLVFRERIYSSFQTRHEQHHFWVWQALLNPNPSQEKGPTSSLEDSLYPVHTRLRQAWSHSPMLTAYAALLLDFQCALVCVKRWWVSPSEAYLCKSLWYPRKGFIHREGHDERRENDAKAIEQCQARTTVCSAHIPLWPCLLGPRGRRALQ